MKRNRIREIKRWTKKVIRCRDINANESRFTSLDYMDKPGMKLEETDDGKICLVGRRTYRRRGRSA